MPDAPKCSDCKHFRRIYGYVGMCMHPDTAEVRPTNIKEITVSLRLSASVARMMSQCGPEGKLFEQRPEEPLFGKPDQEGVALAERMTKMPDCVVFNRIRTEPLPPTREFVEPKKPVTFQMDGRVRDAAGVCHSEWYLQEDCYGEDWRF